MLYNRVKTPSKETTFWEWFQKNEHTYLYLEHNPDVLDELEQQLQKVNTNLSFAIGPHTYGEKRQLIITADGIRSNFPAVAQLTQAAPLFANWNVVAFRQPHHGFTCINYGNIHLKLDDVYFRYAEDSGKIALELHIRNYRRTESWQAMSFILLDSLLGEYDTEMWLTGIDSVRLLEHNVARLFHISQLPGLVKRCKKANAN